MSSHCFPWAKINFSYIGGDDNIVNLSVNGHDYTLNPATANDFSTLTQNISIDVDVNHLVIGTNTISVYVVNSQAFAGFYACGNLMVGYCTFLSGNKSADAFNGKDAHEEIFQVFPNPSTGLFSVVVQEST